VPASPSSSHLARAFAGEVSLTERQGSLLVAGAGVVFSFTAIAYRAVDDATEWQFLFYRGGSTALAMVLLIVLRRGSRPVRLRGVSARTWLAGAVLAAVSMLYILALARTSAAITLFLLAAAPVSAAVFGWVLLRERVQRPTVIAIVATGVGVTVMVGTSIDAGSGAGVLLAGLIPILVGLYNVLIRSEGDVDPVLPALIAGVLLAVVAGTVALVDTGLGVSWRDAGLACVTGGFALGVGLPLRVEPEMRNPRSRPIRAPPGTEPLRGQNGVECSLGCGRVAAAELDGVHDQRCELMERYAPLPPMCQREHLVVGVEALCPIATEQAHHRQIELAVPSVGGRIDQP
jgi:drug/metabolite transporter (DMT)-like permease